MANFKSEIAVALYDSSVNVSREALLWAMSNLPDGENKGQHSTGKLSVEKNFNHDAENVLQALGLTEDDAKRLSGIMAKELAKIKEPDSRVSKIVEGVLNALENDPELIKLIVVKTVQDALDFAQSASEMGDMAKMLKMMKMLGRMKGGDNEE